ncbi:hypothetical protein C8F04DRAFT_1281036 [Mycena alexandri]|uniref:Mon2/Sec7/BIG1-like HUS domain-containing protein n=1 Tax=Mycena alexandri TaxID=1745969 RepID=A0AAD6RXB5_9AGAR|nr:hypothetical protein C8F04DRAFT_1281036 [Mycena alexandri]
MPSFAAWARANGAFSADGVERKTDKAFWEVKKVVRKANGVEEDQPRVYPSADKLRRKRTSVFNNEDEAVVLKGPKWECAMVVERRSTVRDSGTGRNEMCLEVEAEQRQQGIERHKHRDVEAQQLLGVGDDGVQRFARHTHADAVVGPSTYLRVSAARTQNSSSSCSCICALLLKSLSDRPLFPLTLRCTRVVFLLLKQFAPELETEAEIFLTFLIKIVGNDRSEQGEQNGCACLCGRLCSGGAPRRSFESLSRGTVVGGFVQDSGKRRQLSLSSLQVAMS